MIIQGLIFQNIWKFQVSVYSKDRAKYMDQKEKKNRKKDRKERGDKQSHNYHRRIQSLSPPKGWYIHTEIIKDTRGDHQPTESNQQQMIISSSGVTCAIEMAFILSHKGSLQNERITYTPYIASSEIREVKLKQNREVRLSLDN